MYTRSCTTLFVVWASSKLEKALLLLLIIGKCIRSGKINGKIQKDLKKLKKKMMTALLAFWYIAFQDCFAFM